MIPVEVRKIIAASHENGVSQSAVYSILKKYKESGINTNMTRFYGRAKGKKRVYDYVPAKRIKRTTLLSSVRLESYQLYRISVHPLLYNH